MIASLSLNIGSSKKEKKARYDITNVSLKNISKLIKAFEKVTYEGYVRKRPKHELTYCYFYPVRQLDKYTMTADTFKIAR